MGLWESTGGVVGGLIERDWDKRDTVVDQNFEREMVGRQEEFQTTSATTAHMRNQENMNIAHERNLTADHFKHKRNMEGMKAAGLNPILAYQQGAKGLPGASSASSASPSGSKGSARGTKKTSLGSLGLQGIQTSMNMDVAKANIKQIDSQTELNSAKKLEVESKTSKANQETSNLLTEGEILSLKSLQSLQTGDSIAGRLINTILRTGVFGVEEIQKLGKATVNWRGKHRAQLKKFLLKYGFDIDRKPKRKKLKNLNF